MVNLIYPPSYLLLFARCIDDSLPAFDPEEWIEEGKVYQVKHYTESLNNGDDMALTILDEKGEEIHPSPSHWSFASSRFDLFAIHLN